MHFKSPRAGVVRIPPPRFCFAMKACCRHGDGSNHVKLKPIDIRTIWPMRWKHGLRDDLVIDNPSDSLRAGDLVKPSPEPQQPGKAS